jgi:hypothetical protein
LNDSPKRGNEYIKQEIYIPELDKESEKTGTPTGRSKDMDSSYSRG